MSAPVLGAPGAADLLGRLLPLIERRALEAVVMTDCEDLALGGELARLGLPLTAIDVRPGALEAFRSGVAHAYPNVRVIQGAPARTLADLRRRVPCRALRVLGTCGLPGHSPAEQVFWAPRAEGALLFPGASQTEPVALAGIEDQLRRWSPDHHLEWLRSGSGRSVLLALPAPKVHVTFLIEKYTHEYGSSGLSINLDNLVATLAETGLASWNVVHYDQCFHECRPLPIEELVKPAGVDVHVLVTVLHYHSHANPALALLAEVRASGSRIALVWLDKKTSRSSPEYERIADLNVVLDGNDFELPNPWPCFTPKNPRFFNDPGLERDIDVSLVGEIRYLSQRKAMLERLRNETRIRVEFFPTSAADAERALSIAEYARLYQRSKIALALTKDSVRQLKGRVFEVLHCGALLLCDPNHHVSHYLRPGVDYVVWHDYDDLVDKARYYLDHDQERLAIARAGHARVKSHYSHAVFWKSLLARLGGSAAAFHAGR